MALIQGSLRKQGVKAIQFIGSPFQGERDKNQGGSLEDYLGPFKLVKKTGFAIMFPPNKGKTSSTEIIPPLAKIT